MHTRFGLVRRRSVLTLVVVLCLSAGTAVRADEPLDPRWEALRRQSRQVVTDLLRQQAATAPESANEIVAAPPASRIVVIGFTGGLEGADSRVSGVVRLRRRIADHVGNTPNVEARTYSNFAWRKAATEIVAEVRALQPHDGSGPDGRRPAPPVIVVYGHSWGAGAIGKFARAIDDEGLEIALAVYIDAFTVRKPRVPVNVRTAVNIYQRTGIFRGWPIRGKSGLVARSPETTILANLRVTPETRRFGWSWNLIQPLFYRQHHRIGYDARIERLLLDLASLPEEGSEVEEGSADQRGSGDELGLHAIERPLDAADLVRDPAGVADAQGFGQARERLPVVE